MDFGFAIERDILVQPIKLWFSYIKSTNGSDSFNSRTPRVKLRPANTMHWNYSMGNVDVSHRLMTDATLPTSTGLNSQKSISFKFFTFLVANAYRVWNLYRNADGILIRYDVFRNGSRTAFDVRTSIRQLLRRSCFQFFLEKTREILLSLSDEAICRPLSDIPGAQDLHIKCSSLALKRKRFNAANQLSAGLKRLHRGVPHNQVLHTK